MLCNLGGFRPPVKGYFGSEFPVICNQCGVISAGSRTTLNIFGSSEKRPLTVNFSKWCSESSHRDTNRCVAFKFREKLGWQEISEIVCCFSCPKNSSGSLAVTTVRIVPKICQGKPPTIYSECTRFRLNAVHFRRSYRREHPKRTVKWIQYLAEAQLWANKCWTISSYMRQM